MSRVRMPQLLGSITENGPITANPADSSTASPFETPPRVRCAAPQPLGFSSISPPDSLFGSLSHNWNRYQKRYWNIMQIRKKMSGPQPSAEFVGTVLEDHPIGDIITTRLSGDGATYILGFISELRLIHLELNVVVSIPIGFGDTILEGRRLYVPLASGNFDYKGEEGLMFASTFRRRDEILVYFMPISCFHSSPNGSTSSDTHIFAQVNLPGGHIVQQLMFSGRFLIIGSTPDLLRHWLSYRVFDMASRKTYRAVEEGIKALSLIALDDKFLVALHPTEEVTVYALPPPWTLSPSDALSGPEPELILLPHKASHSPDPTSYTALKFLMPGIYFEDMTDRLPTGITYFDLYLAEGPSQMLPNTQPSSLWWREDQPRVKAPFKTAFPHVASREDHTSTHSHKHISLPRFLSRRSPDTVDHFRSVGLVHSGPTSILICAKPVSKVDAPLIIAHLTFERGSTHPTAIEQKPLLMRKKNQKRQDVLERPDCGLAERFFTFEWSEHAGRIILRTSDGANFRFDLYKL